MPSTCACHGSSNAAPSSFSRRGLSGVSGPLKVTLPSIDVDAIPMALRMWPQLTRLEFDSVERLWLDDATCHRIGERPRPMTVVNHASATARIGRQPRMICRDHRLHSHLVTFGKKRRV